MYQEFNYLPCKTVYGLRQHCNKEKERALNSIFQLVTIVERIQRFPVTSPLMKFVNGLEIILAKGQEWEQIAAKHVSLSSHLESITHMIIQWRKLELE